MNKRTVEQIGLALVTLSITGMSLLLFGCGGGSSHSGAGADAVPLKPNMTRAIARIKARGEGWLLGVDSIKAADRDPPHPASWATVKCPGDVVLYRTTFDKPVDFFERLLVHEAYEIQHGCKDNDQTANAFSRCYSKGRSYGECVREVE